VAAQLDRVDGVMLGREAYHNPYLLADVDRRFFGDDHPVPDRHEVVERLLPYVSDRLDEGVPLQAMTATSWACSRAGPAPAPGGAI
jgi:tRNA-dihydrouridine synthase A